MEPISQQNTSHKKESLQKYLPMFSLFVSRECKTKTEEVGTGKDGK